MKTETKESISRILLTVFVVMLPILLTFMVPPGVMVPLYASLGFLPIIMLFLGVPRHQKYVGVGLVLILIFVMVDNIAGQKLHQKRTFSYLKRITELEQQLDEHKGQNNNAQTEQYSKEEDL